MKARGFLASTAAALILGGCGGCDRWQAQQKERAFDRGNQAAKEGDDQEAQAAYEDALDGTPATAEAYYRLALLEDDKLHHLTGAIHHYERFLELATSGHPREVEDAKRFLKNARFKLLTELSTGALISQKDAARLRNDNLELHKKIIELTAQVNQLREQRNAALKQTRAIRAKAPMAAPGLPEKAPPGAQTYIVQKGDTLASISRRFYQNNDARWEDILDANYYRLNGKTNLKLGETLIIPK